MHPHHEPAPRVDQDSSPYADALLAYAAAGRQRFTTPGHQADAAGQPLLAGLLGERVLTLDVQPTVEGVDHGPGNAMEHSLGLAADAWGARRTWLLTNGSSQGNLTAWGAPARRRASPSPGSATRSWRSAASTRPSSTG
jgi:arginine decarboxylase